jgi:N-acetylmuramoyl-L-alanine amidase
MDKGMWVFMMKDLAAAAKARGAPINPAIVAAQAALESRYGDSELYRTARNPFGIKGQYQGRSVVFPTWEQDASGGWVKVNASFRDYPTLLDAFSDYGDIIRRLPFYQDAEDAQDDARAYLKGIVAKRDELGRVVESGWATDHLYEKKVWDIVQEWKLEDFPTENSGTVEQIILHMGFWERFSLVSQGTLRGKFTYRVRPKTEGEGFKIDIA